MITEFGGTAFTCDTTGDNWGYGSGVDSKDDFLQRFDKLVSGIDAIPFVCGYCYTQLSDIQQEVNGLQDANHVNKFEASKIRQIIESSGR